MIDAGPAARIVLLINARSRQGPRAARAVAEALARVGLRLDRVIEIGRPERIGAAVEALLARGDLERLIVGGGDGTLNAAAPRLARREVLLGVIPLGTANDFARTLGIPANIEAAATIAAGRHVHRIDLARSGDADFLNVASIGMSVAATSVLSPTLKRWIGPLAYAIAGARAFVRHPTFRTRIEAAGVDFEGEAHQVVVANGRFYGGGVLVGRRSTLDDSLLTVSVLGTRSRWRLLRTIALQKFQVPLDRPGDFFIETPAVRVTTWPPRRVNLDGEIRGQTPADFAVDPGALLVLTPEGTATRTDV